MGDAHRLRNRLLEAHEFPLGVLTAVTGVSGAGKSTLVNAILYPALARRYHGATRKVGKHRKIVGLSRLGRGHGAEGAGRLCTLHFTAVGSGDAALSFARASVRDGYNRILDARFDPLQIDVQ